MKNSLGNLVAGFNKIAGDRTGTKSTKDNTGPNSGSPYNEHATRTSSTSLISSLGGLPSHVATGVTDVVNNVTDYLKVAEQEKTKRTDIKARRDVALASIKAQRKVFSELMQYTFQERAAVLQKQFETLDKALESGNVEVAALSLNSMVSVIQSSPFKTIQEMQQALGNKDFVVRLE
ncbi:hypothetical protein ETQ85_14325 [Zoogloea oleivorans]|jgi:hypothetical protein|uniref:Uncharacterized protein n=1 Tax=Zoogloea oleivorans TaxID=1552750 RepID=A0A6C2CNB3_9RHOO|nr:hypothetical protein [Zoogloea oleivorans]TYC55196.1 hypothetical protein ETQ85_14325 [Zoogloea oleivorans]